MRKGSGSRDGPVAGAEGGIGFAPAAEFAAGQGRGGRTREPELAVGHRRGGGISSADPTLVEGRRGAGEAVAEAEVGSSAARADDGEAGDWAVHRAGLTHRIIKAITVIGAQARRSIMHTPLDHFGRE